MEKGNKVIVFGHSLDLPQSPIRNEEDFYLIGLAAAVKKDWAPTLSPDTVKTVLDVSDKYLLGQDRFGGLHNLESVVKRPLPTFSFSRGRLAGFKTTLGSADQKFYLVNPGIG